MGLVLSLNACAQRVDMAAEDASIREVLTQNFAAFESQDWDAVGGLISDDWVIVTNLGVLDRAGIQELFEARITDHSITISNIDITVSAGGSMAWAKFDENTQYNFDGAPVDEHALFTAVLEKDAGGWKLVHIQRTVLVEAEM
jgi:ketosteroid isomerase-like protein